MRKNSLLLLVLFVIGLYVLTNKGIVPLVAHIAESNFGDSNDDDSEPVGETNSEQARAALSQCSAYVRKKHRAAANATFSKQYKIWSMGAHTYLVRSTYSVEDPKARVAEHGFACTMKFKSGDFYDPDNWEPLALDLAK